MHGAEEKNSKRYNLVSHRGRPKPPLHNHRKRGSSGAGPCFLLAQAESSSWDPLSPWDQSKAAHRNTRIDPRSSETHSGMFDRRLAPFWAGSGQAGRARPSPRGARAAGPLPTPLPV